MEERLNRLEGENWRLRRILSLAGVVFASVVVIGASVGAGTSEVLKARKFVLEDEKGNIRATLGLDKNNEAFLALFDQSGKARAAFMQEPEAQFEKTGVGVPKDTIRRYAIPRTRP